MRRYWLPLLSGVLLAFALEPFSLWPLVLCALAPFFYFAALPHLSTKQTFFGAFLAGAVAVAPTLYWSLLQLMPQSGAPLLTGAVRASSLFFLIFIGVLFGLMAVLYRALLTGRPLADSLTAASLYTAIELILFVVFGGYYYASLAHALTPFPPALLVASLGGVPLLIFAAAWMSAAIAQRSRRLILGSFIFLAVICAGTFWFGKTYLTSGQGLTVAVIQRLPESLRYVTAPAPLPFDDYGLRSLITEATRGGDTALVVYPYSPVELVYEGPRPSIPNINNFEPESTLGAWLHSFVPASSTVMLWDTTAQQGSLYDGFDFWSAGERQAYQKHLLYPLSDYTPQWLRALGLARLPYTLSSGMADSVVAAGTRVGGLACSELQQEGYARTQAAQSDMLLSVGFDGFFPGALPGDWSLRAARLRAAENGIPLVRGYIQGPSALIRRDGSIAASLPYGVAGTMYGTLALGKIPTLYALVGSAPTYVLVAASLALACYRRVHKTKFLGSADL